MFFGLCFNCIICLSKDYKWKHKKILKLTKLILNLQGCRRKLPKWEARREKDTAKRKNVKENG